jgi:hypothetical protein
MPRPLQPNDHVDIVHNQWSAGTQSIEARVSVTDGKVRFRGVLAAQWRQRLVEKSVEAGLPDPVTEPELFVASLHDRYDNDYFFATEPHDRGQCPFGSKRVVQMSGTPPHEGSTVATARAHG